MDNIWTSIIFVVGGATLAGWAAYVIGTMDCPAGKVAVRAIFAYTCVSP